MIELNGLLYDCATEEEALEISELQNNPPALTSQEISEDNLHLLRERRSHLLKETDWWAGSDHTMTTEQTTYRQALRDITDTYSSIDTVVWPTKPQEIA